jgi:hypothetical protein
LFEEGAMSDMQKAYTLAALAVRQRFSEQHPADLKSLDSIQAGEVVAYTGSFDQVQEVLKCLRVPVEVDPKPAGLRSAAKIAFLNCSSGYQAQRLNLLAEQVSAGLWLVSSDWALPQIGRVFPNTVRYTGKPTGDEVVSVEPAMESLWSEVVVLGADPQWWIEGSSYPIEVLDGTRVRVEAASHDLLVRHQAPVVAVDFAWERGRVFHIISHFWHKRSRTPAARYQGPGVDFLRAGMRLSEAGIARVLEEGGAKEDTVNFAALQSAATATELVAQLCVRAKRTHD